MAEDSGFSISGLFGGVNDTFSELAKTYLNIEGLKAQTGALKAQAEYNLISNPNAYPLTPQQMAALQAQRAGAISPALLIGGGIALIALVLVLK
jgi:hypothetical protein